MVSFICDACQETVRKNKVDTHVTRCPDSWKLSCIDCMRAFEGEAYRSHTSCISEAEKYEGKLFHKKGGEKADPQTRWMETVKKVGREQGRKGNLARVFQQMSDLDNVPRKKKKFVNFMQNGFRVSQSEIDEIWELLQKEWEAGKPSTKGLEDPSATTEKNETSTSQNDASSSSSSMTDKKSEKKSKKWKQAIKRAVEDSTKRKMKIDDLMTLLEKKKLSIERRKLIRHLQKKKSLYKLSKNDTKVKIACIED